MAQCQTLFGTSTFTQTTVTNTPELVTITLAPATSTAVVTSTVVSCTTITQGVAASGLSVQPDAATSCRTDSTVLTETSVIAGGTTVSTSYVPATITNVQTSAYATYTSCAAAAAAAPTAASSTTPTAVTTASPTSSTVAQSISTVVITTTLPNGLVATSASLTPVLIPAGQDSSSSGSGSSSTGAIVGGVLGGIAAVFILVLLFFGCRKSRGPLAFLRRGGDDPDGLDEEYWAPAIATSSADDEEAHEKTAGGGRTSSLVSDDVMTELHAGAGFHQRSLSNGGAGTAASGTFQRSSSSYSYMSDGNRPRSPPLNYPSRPPSTHSSPSYYSNYMQPMVTTSASGAPIYYTAPYPTSPVDFHSGGGLARHPSSGSLPPGVLTAQPYYGGGQQAPVQRSRSAHSARAMGYMQGQRLSQWEETDESADPRRQFEGDLSSLEGEGSVEEPQSPILRLVTTNADISPSANAVAAIPTEGSWLASEHKP